MLWGDPKIARGMRDGRLAVGPARLWSGGGKPHHASPRSQNPPIGLMREAILLLRPGPARAKLACWVLPEDTAVQPEHPLQVGLLIWPNGNLDHAGDESSCAT